MEGDHRTKYVSKPVQRPLKPPPPPYGKQEPARVNLRREIREKRRSRQSLPWSMDGSSSHPLVVGPSFVPRKLEEWLRLGHRRAPTIESGNLTRPSPPNRSRSGHIYPLQPCVPFGFAKPRGSTRNIDLYLPDEEWLWLDTSNSVLQSHLATRAHYRGGVYTLWPYFSAKGKSNMRPQIIRYGRKLVSTSQVPWHRRPVMSSLR